VNISITFRHMDASEAIKSYAADKIGKLQKFLRQPMTAKVTLSIDRLKHIAETRISSGGSHLEAKESSADMYASIDRVIDKLERQIRGAKGAAQSKKRRSGDSLRGTDLAAAVVAKRTTKKKAKKKASSKR
jgi:putative sigma-54 modulation protein